jgi:hypothetical protein
LQPNSKDDPFDGPLIAKSPASSAAEPFRRVANLWKIFGGRVFLRIARRHTAVTASPQRKSAQPALPPVCRKTRRRS